MENPVDFEGLGTHVENEEIDGVIDITRLVDERTNSPNSDSIPKTEVKTTKMEDVQNGR